MFRTSCVKSVFNDNLQFSAQNNKKKKIIININNNNKIKTRFQANIKGVINIYILMHTIQNGDKLAKNEMFTKHHSFYQSLND